MEDISQQTTLRRVRIRAAQKTTTIPHYVQYLGPVGGMNVIIIVFIIIVITVIITITTIIIITIIIVILIIIITVIIIILIIITIIINEKIDNPPAYNLIN